MRGKRSIVFFIVIMLISTTLVGAQQQDYIEDGLQSLLYYSSALDRIIPALKPLDSAAKSFQNSINYEENVDEALLLLALVYLEQDDFKSASESLLQYLSLYPEDYWVYVLLADIEYTLNNFDSALENYHRALSDDEYARAYYGIGRIYAQRGLSGDAIDALSQAVEIEPSFTEARIALAEEYYITEQYDSALEEFELSYSHNPRNAKVHYYLWLLYLDQGEIEKAHHSRDLAIQYDPHYRSLIETDQ